MRNVIIKLRVNDSPKRPLLHCTLAVLAVQERHVKHLSSLVAPCNEQCIVLEVGVLDVTRLFKLGDIDVCLSHRRLPAIVG